MKGGAIVRVFSVLGPDTPAGDICRERPGCTSACFRREGFGLIGSGLLACLRLRVRVVWAVSGRPSFFVADGGWETVCFLPEQRVFRAFAFVARAVGLFTTRNETAHLAPPVMIRRGRI